MRRAFVALAITTALTVLAACSDDGDNDATPTSTSTSVAPTTTTAPSTSTSGPRGTTTTVPTGTTPATVGGSGGTGSSSGTANGRTVRIINFRYAGSSPVECNAPTSIELAWTVSGAQNVEMHIDGGPVFARYENGAQQELLPLACDGRAHTYELVATAPDITVKRSITVQTRVA